MTEPANHKEYLDRFHANTVIEGYGLDLANRVPCPWCAASDFQILHPVAGIIPEDDRPNIDQQMETEHTCSECGRSGRAIVTRDNAGVRFEYVQTGGDDPPEWLNPPPRRI